MADSRADMVHPLREGMGAWSVRQLVTLQTQSGTRRGLLSPLSPFQLVWACPRVFPPQLLDYRHSLTGPARDGPPWCSGSLQVNSSCCHSGDGNVASFLPCLRPVHHGRNTQWANVLTHAGSKVEKGEQGGVHSSVPVTFPGIYPPSTGPCLLKLSLSTDNTTL